MSKASLPILTSFQESNGGNQSGESGEKKVYYFNYELEPGFTIRLRQEVDPNMDLKEVRRIISNRISVQRSRWKKLQYAKYPERKIQEIEAGLSVWRARNKMLFAQNKILSEIVERLKIKNKKLEELPFAATQRCISDQDQVALGEVLLKLREIGDEIMAYKWDTGMRHFIL
ncbi:hypothetical protein AALP_AA8G067100 [Arabis alpina]|uniref:BZIP domain-containing protein n=1 Tax=Arabis alpina TaxID=50452 RepID=A0A087G5F7_ARAAL|nr:hypothetical protein AALP_AA8G067100 [Arabis alpina]